MYKRQQPGQSGRAADEFAADGDESSRPPTRPNDAENQPTQTTPAWLHQAEKRQAATQKKIARDCSKKGDSWFRTGDLMRRDAGGYYYFVDRAGDTYRWKGENVATTEVAGVVARAPGRF